MDTWEAAISGLRRELKGALEAAITRIFVSAQFSHSSPTGSDDAMQSADENDPGSNQRGQRPVSRVQPWGINGCPTNKVRGVALRLGASNLIFIGILPTQGYGSQALADGETELYCSAGGTSVKLDKDGNITINAASGKDVTVNGGSAKVGRVGDSVNMGKFAFVPGTGSAQLSWTPPGSLTPQIITAAVELDGVISAGADHLKG